jgi:hypothetical protein
VTAPVAVGHGPAEGALAPGPLGVEVDSLVRVGGVGEALHPFGVTVRHPVVPQRYVACANQVSQARLH